MRPGQFTTKFMTQVEMRQLRWEEAVMRSVMKREGIKGSTTLWRWGCGCMGCAVHMVISK